MKSNRLDEHRVLIRHLAALQVQCTDALSERDATIDRLSAQLIRLQAELVIRDTRLAMLGDALAALQHPMNDMIREAPEGPGVEATKSDLATIAQDVERTLSHRNAFDQDDIDAALSAQDVICQTGCISHGHYWRRGDACTLNSVRCTAAPASSRDIDTKAPVTSGETRETTPSR